MSQIFNEKVNKNYSYSIVTFNPSTSTTKLKTQNWKPLKTKVDNFIDIDYNKFGHVGLRLFDYSQTYINADFVQTIFVKFVSIFFDISSSFKKPKLNRQKRKFKSKTII